MKHRISVPTLFFVLALGWPAIVCAQGPPQESALDRQLFPPELVMQNQTALGLTEAQRRTLVEEIQSLQSDVVPIQVEMSEAMEALVDLVSEAQVDEEAAVAQSLKVMDFESRIKSRHLTLLIRIKNLLSPEQQERLRELRRGRTLPSPPAGDQPPASR